MLSAYTRLASPSAHAQVSLDGGQRVLMSSTICVRPDLSPVLGRSLVRSRMVGHLLVILICRSRLGKLTARAKHLFLPTLTQHSFETQASLNAIESSEEYFPRY